MKPPSRPLIIAEVTSNHGGDLECAKAFIHAAVDAGVDFVKFQSWQAKRLAPDDPQRDWFEKAELTDSMHSELIAECKKTGIGFLTTIFDADRIEFLQFLGINEIKIGSADTLKVEMLQKASKAFDHIILSTGMVHDSELEEVLQQLPLEKFTLMHCVSKYPTPPEQINMHRMDWLKQFTECVGYSDHFIGTAACKLALSRGANYIEKHFTLGEGKCPRTMPWDGTPEEFSDLVKFRDDMLPMMQDDEWIKDPVFNKNREFFFTRFGA